MNNFDNWLSLNYLNEKHKIIIDNYFKDKKGIFKIENDVLIVNFESWGIEKFYLNNSNIKEFYKIEYENIRNIYDIAISVQIGNWNTFKKMEHYLNNFKNINVNIYFIIINDILNIESLKTLKKYNNIAILSCENRGMDIGLFFVNLHYIKSKKYHHDYLYKIHTKTHDIFRNETLNNLMESHDKIINNIKLLSNDNIGMISGNFIFKYHENKDIFKSNYYHLDNLVNYLFNEKINNDYLEFPSATFFIAKFKIFNILTLDKLEFLYFNLNNTETLDCFWYSMYYNMNINNKNNIYKDYINNKQVRYPNNLAYQKRTNKPGLRDCMIEHAFERLFGYMCKIQHLNITK
jgi:hypothetical protein